MLPLTSQSYINRIISDLKPHHRLRIRKHILMQTNIPRSPPLPLPLKLKIIPQQKIRNNHLDRIGREEPARARIFTMPKMHVRVAGGCELVACAFPGKQAVLVVAETVEAEGVGGDGFVDDDGVDGHHEVDALGEEGAVGEGEGFFDGALKANYEKELLK